MPHSISHSDTCPRLFNKKWGIPVLGERDNFPSLGVPKRLALKQPLNQVWAFLRSVCSRGISAMVSRTLARSEAKASCPNGLARFTAPGGVRIGSRQRILPLQLSPARSRRTGGQSGQRNPSGQMPLDDSGMAQDESGGAAGGGGRCEQRFTSSLRKPITAPCGSLTQLAARSGTSAGTQLRFFQCTRWRSRAATWVSLMILSATPPRYSA